MIPKTAGVRGLEEVSENSKPALSRSSQQSSSSLLSRPIAEGVIASVSVGNNAQVAVQRAVISSAQSPTIQWADRSVQLFNRAFYAVRYTAPTAEDKVGSVVDGIAFGIKSAQLDSLVARKLQGVVEERIAHLKEIGVPRGDEAMVGIMGKAVHRDIKQVFAEIRAKWGVRVQGDSEMSQIAAETLAEIRRQWKMPVQSGSIN